MRALEPDYGAKITLVHVSLEGFSLCFALAPAVAAAPNGMRDFDFRRGDPH
jgi:hypothetical protein